MPKFDPSKPVQTRDGRRARIICTDRKHHKAKTPIIALVTMKEIETPFYFYENGKFYETTESETDLVNIPVKWSTWSVLFENGVIGNYAINSFSELKSFLEGRSPSFKPVGGVEKIFEDGKVVDLKYHELPE